MGETRVVDEAPHSHSRIQFKGDSPISLLSEAYGLSNEDRVIS